MKAGMEHLRGIRYKLRMMGVPLSGPSYIYGDNMSVIHNTQRPESTLKKKNNSIFYHALREAVAMGECLTKHIPTKDNLSDMMSKVLYGSKKRGIVEGLMYDVNIDDEREHHWGSVFEDNERGVDYKALLHAKRWDLYLNEKGKLVKGKY